MIGEPFRPADSLLRALSGAPIRVGTQNATKIEAVRLSFAAFADPDVVLDLIPVAVESGVPEQPIGFEEILRGARNRARAAFDSGDGTLAVGIEDGLLRYSEHESARAVARDAGVAEVGNSSEGHEMSSDVFYNVGCAWLMDGERVGHGFSAGFSYPRECREPAVRHRQPIGELFDALWRSKRGAAQPRDLDPSPDAAREPVVLVASGRQGGNIGLLTQGRLDRASYGAQAVTCALIRFLHTDLYD